MSKNDATCVDARAGSPHEYDAVGELFGEEVQVEYRAVGVDYEFGFGNDFFHIDSLYVS